MTQPPAPTADEQEVVVVPMRRRHLRGVLRIESATRHRPWSLGLFLGELSLRESRAYLVAKEGPAVVGFAGTILAADESHITTVAVDPAWHRRTIGTRLMLALARESIRRGARHLTLEVRVGNEAAQALYRRFGFAPAGIRKNYYAEIREDALVMWAYDIDAPAYAERLRSIEASLPSSTPERSR